MHARRYPKENDRFVSSYTEGVRNRQYHTAGETPQISMQKQTFRIFVITCMFAALGYMLWSWHSETVAEVFALKTRLKNFNSYTEKSHEDVRGTIFEDFSPPNKYFQGIGDDVLQVVKCFCIKRFQKPCC